MRKIIIAYLLLLTACAPSEESIQQAIAQTQAAYTPTPQSTETPDPLPAFMVAYLDALDAWYINFERVIENNERIANEGSSILSNAAFREELTAALSDFDESAKTLAEIKPPTQETQILQDKAEELQSETQIFTSTYMLALLGTGTIDTSITALKNASELYLEIVEILKTFSPS